ncbi:hypothetical protein JX265_013395 [Neoarthrinium moseri]|uniref:Uncharacterized protein n=1 Tax=Neoarthrinium moseri TaxID=1658444 RepID=A0A9P9W953_9PEZI|nr:uncharacterized protein JN550_012809 [Neoarthrinium moseri]KAI1840899.1 hypothetical protein JX266_012909 [Neoarthrinium moseri]KAI1850503.1 hypothetical protein JX265_013395 [Neoarthrinium moseri]KAI1858278.1 hypothetical protein JN550_012809 [Neoarthrinium moseri]
MTQVIQLGLLVEAVLNVIGAAVFIRYPAWCLSYVVSSDTVPPSAAVLWQIYGGLVLALTIPILLVIPNSPTVFEQRSLIFKTLTAGELVLIGVLSWHASKPIESGFTWSGLALSAMFLLPALTWHSCAAFVLPDLMRPSTRIRDNGEARKGL